MGFWSSFRGGLKQSVGTSAGSAAPVMDNGEILAQEVINWDRYRYVQVDGGSLDVKLDDERPQEYPLALKEIKLAKKELTAEKRLVAQQIAEIRAEHRDKQAHRAPSIRGGGNLGRAVRATQAVSKANDRRNTADAVRPLEDQKFIIDRLISALDHAALEVERLISDAR